MSVLGLEDDEVSTLRTCAARGVMETFIRVALVGWGFGLGCRLQFKMFFFFCPADNFSLPCLGCAGDFPRAAAGSRLHHYHGNH